MIAINEPHSELITTALDPGVVGEEFLAALRLGADAYLADQRPANTQDAYAEDWKVWTTFCAEKGVPVTLANADMLMGFVVWMEHARDYAPSTMVRRVAGTVRTLRDRLGEQHVPKGISGRATEAINAYERRLNLANQKRGRGQAPLITTEMAAAMVATQPLDTLLGLRNRALLIMWYHLGGRRAELAQLLVTDVTDVDDALLLRLRHTKTGPREPIIVARPGSETCPVAAWRTWLAASGITEGPAFPRMHRSGTLLGPITPKSVGTVVTEAGRAAGITVHLRSHGMRAGHITTALERGADLKTVALQTGLDPGGRAIWRYVRKVELRTNNTSALIDLD